jgi:hypothetical protein
MSPDTRTQSAPVPQSLDSLFAALRAHLSPPAELLTRETFAALLDVGVSTFDRLRETGEIGPQPIRLAGLKWHRAEALAWLSHRAANGELYDAKTWPAVWASLHRQK